MQKNNFIFRILFILLFSTFISCGESVEFVEPADSSVDAIPDNSSGGISTSGSSSSGTTSSSGSSSGEPQSTILTKPNLLSESSKLTLFTGTSMVAYKFENIEDPVSSCNILPDLPEGIVLSVNNGTCQIIGEPVSVSSEITYSVTGTNEKGSDSASIKILIKNKDNPPNLSNISTEKYFIEGIQIQSITFKNSGGLATSCSSSPTIPSGLTIKVSSSGSCIISGTPSSPAATRTYTITAKNSVHSDIASVVITVSSSLEQPGLVNVASALVLPKDEPMTEYSFKNTGGETKTCTALTLPNGINVSSDISSGTCVLSGTPGTVSAPYSYIVTGTNQNGSSNASISISVVDTKLPPDIDNISDNKVYNQESTDLIIFDNSGGPVTSCTSSPVLPQGFTLNVSNDTCRIIVSFPLGDTSSDRYSITASNSYGDDSTPATIDVQIQQVVVPPDLVNLDYSAGLFTLYYGVEMDSFNLPKAGGGEADICSTTDFPTGVTAKTVNGECQITGTPEVTTDTYAPISSTLTASNSAGADDAVALNFNIFDPNHLPKISIGGVFPAKLYKNIAISDFAFPNAGGPVNKCDAATNDNSQDSLPDGLYIAISNGTCVIKGKPTVTSSYKSYKVIASNGLGANAIGHDVLFSFSVEEQSLLKATDFNSGVIKFIDNSFSGFRPNQLITIDAGKYYGADYSRYFNLFVYGPYDSTTDIESIDLTNDNYDVHSLSLENIDIPLGEWFNKFLISYSTEGVYKVYAAFCVSSVSRLSVPDECKLSATPSHSKTFEVSLTPTGGGGGGGSSSVGWVTDEQVIGIVKDLQNKTSAELLRDEEALRSGRLQKAIENIQTRDALLDIENELQDILSDNLSFTNSILTTKYPDVLRILEIFKLRYDAVAGTLDLERVTEGYKKARIAWEYLFPFRNGHIKRSPELYSAEVSSGEKYPYTFKHFLMATALYPNFCGSSVALGVSTTEAKYKELCTLSIAEMFAHFTQEVGAHDGNPINSYSAPVNGTVITAEGAIDAGGMKIFSCQGAYDSALCADGAVIPEWRQGMYWINESGCSESSSGCDYRECHSTSWQAQAWPCPTGIKYFGRGAKQLSYNYNYGPFSHVVYGTVHTLLQDPGKVTEGWLALASAVYFFMQPRPPKPSMFERVYGFWSLPSGLDGGHLNLMTGNFAASIMIINGGIECGGSTPIAQASNRVKYFMGFMDFFGVDTSGYDQASDSMTCANTPLFDTVHGASYDSYWVDMNWIGGCFLVAYETPYSGFIPRDYESCIRSIELPPEEEEGAE